jgi:class 3 adenylate cyclase
MNTVNWPQELARRQRVNRTSNWITLFANAVGAILAEFYFVLGGAHQMVNANTGGVSFAWILLIVGLLVLGANLGNRREKPLRQWYLSAEPPTAPPSPEVQRQALRAPLEATLISGAMWTLAGLTSGISSGIRPDGFDFVGFLLIFLSVAGLSGGVSAALVYFITERIWASELPLFFPEGTITHIRTFRMTVRRRVMVLFVLEGVPLLLLAVVAYNQARSFVSAADPAEGLAMLLRLELFIVGIGVISALTLALTLGRSLITSVEDLLAHMNTVRQGNLEAPMPITSNDEFGALAEGFNAMVKGLRQEEVVRALFSLYVTPEVAEHAIQYGAELGGQLAEVSVLFSDIRGFTSMTEKMAPEALIALLNRYFDAMSDAVIAEDGLINKFGGDSLLAVFGTPLNPTREHAAQAVRAAQGMLAALDTFNADQTARGEPTLRIGVGVASGAVVAGNVGSEERLEYTVIGDTVNLASRLQTMTKELGVPLLMAESTVQQLADRDSYVAIGQVEVRGKQAPVSVFTLKDGGAAG